MKKLIFILSLFLVAQGVVIAQTIVDEEFRDGNQPSGWSVTDIIFKTTGDGFAQFTKGTGILTSPEIDLSGYSSVYITFDVAKFGNGDNGPITVEISDDGGSSWKQTFDSPTPTGSTYMTSGPTAVTSRGANTVFRFTSANSTSSDKRFRDLIIVGQEENPNGSLITSVIALSDFTYEEGDGPSGTKSFKLTGEDLLGNIDVDFTFKNEYWELYTDAETWGDGYTLENFDGQELTFGLRLKAGLDANSYIDTLIISSDGLDDVKIALAGIIKPTRPSFDFFEDFENSNATASYTDGSFVGNYGITWNYVATRDENGDANNSGIDGKALMLRRVADNSAVKSSAIAGGIGDLSVMVYKGFTAAGNRQVELFINGISYGKTDGFDDNDGHLFVFKNINIEGLFTIEFKNTTTGQVIVDGIAWSKYESGYDLILTGSDGWRMMAAPSSDTYADFLSPIWTQGIATGAKTTEGQTNVLYYDFDDEEFVSFTSLNANAVPGKGFITYVFKSDDYVSEGSFPKTLSLSAAKVNDDDVNATLNQKTDSSWTLLGNPYLSIIGWDYLEKSGLSEVVYAYDSNTKSYVSYSDGVGDLAHGLILPFTGFWVQNFFVGEETSSSLVFNEDSKAENHVFKRNTSQKASFKLIAELDGLHSSAWFSFNEAGSTGRDRYDAVKLAPMDYAPYLSLAAGVNGTALDINNLPLDLSESVEIPLMLEYRKPQAAGYQTAGGTVTLSVSDFRNIPEGWALTLNNYNTGESLNLRDLGTYSFELVAKAKTIASAAPLSALTPAGITEEGSLSASGLSITITPAGDSPTTAEPQQKPVVFALEQNYPNPFNPATTIKYSVPQDGHVQLTIYNVMGQKVAELVNGQKTTGNYAAVWDAGQTASGLYFYRLSANGQTITRRMTLIK